MALRVAVFGTLGALATAFAAVLVFAPGAVLSLGPITALTEALDASNPRPLLVAGSLAVGLAVSLAARSIAGDSSAEGGDAFDAATAAPPETVTAARQRRTADAVDAEIDAAVAGDDEAVEFVRKRLRETATAGYARAVDCDRETARAAVESGEWTGDRTAAAFLSDADGPTHSIPSRLRLWLDPESERERRIRRAIDAATASAEADR